MTDPRWTPETEEVGVQAYGRIFMLRPLPEDIVRVVLGAFADAGQLVEPGSETREEWRVSGDPGHGYPPYEHVYGASHEDPEKAARAFLVMLTRPGGIYRQWIDGPYLTHRTVHVGPWRA